uniref:Secreted protein n=1 Tax=Ixodes scapularis TaxID=6945 RepID=A0A4D5RAN5_IXOSC
MLHSGVMGALVAPLCLLEGPIPGPGSLVHCWGGGRLVDGGRVRPFGEVSQHGEDRWPLDSASSSPPPSAPCSCLPVRPSVQACTPSACTGVWSSSAASSCTTRSASSRWPKSTLLTPSSRMIPSMRPSRSTWTH